MDTFTESNRVNENVANKHLEECRQIALYDDQLSKAMNLLRKISEVHYVALHSGCNEVSAASGALMHRVRDLESEIKASCTVPVNTDVTATEPARDYMSSENGGQRLHAPD